jgi:hypothetical protein
MIKAGTILEWEETLPYYAAMAGALAIALSDEDNDGMVQIQWLAQTKHLSLSQAPGGYYVDQFIPVTIDTVKSNNTRGVVTP